VGQCIELHQGEIEELTLCFFGSASVNNSIVGPTPALRRLKEIRFYGLNLISQKIGELSGIAVGCDTLEEFGYNLSYCDTLEEFDYGFPGNMSTDDFKAICQLLSTFPSLKRVTRDVHDEMFDWHEEGRLTAFLEMVKTSKTIEEVPLFLYGKAAIKYHCRNNKMHNRIELIHEEGLLAANVPNNVWPLILEEFSDMPDVLYYLLHEKNGAMIGPTRHG